MKISPQSVYSATLILMITTLISNMLGVGREVLVASTFGVSADYDAFLLAQYLPGLLFSGLFYGIPNVYTPLYYDVMKIGGEREAMLFQRQFSTVWSIMIVGVTLVMVVLANPVSSLIAGKLPSLQVAMVARMTRWLALMVGTGGMFALLRALVNARGHFTSPAIASLFYNITLIACILTASSVLSVGALVLGSVLGMFIQVVVQLILVRGEGMQLGWRTGFTKPEIIRSFSLAVPVIGFELLVGLYWMTDGYFASGLPEGSVSAINYALVLFRFPGFFIGYSLGSALLPSLSEAVSRDALQIAGQKFGQALRLILVVSIVLTCGVAMFGEEFVAIIYERGAFDAAATHRTTEVLVVLASGFLAIVAYPVVARGLIALNGSNVLLGAFISAVVIKVSLYLTVFRSLGTVGIAWATVIGLTTFVIAASLSVRARLGQHWPNGLIKDLLKGIGVCLIVLVLGYAGHRSVALLVMAGAIVVLYRAESLLLWNLSLGRLRGDLKKPIPPITSE